MLLPVGPWVGEDVSFAVDDRRMALAAKRDGLLHLADVIEAERSEGDPIGAETLDQEQRRVALPVGDDVAELRRLADERIETPQSLRRNAVTDYTQAIDPETHAAVAIDDAEVSKADAPGEVDGGIRGGLNAWRFGKKHEGRLGVLGIAVKRRSDVAGEQEVFLRDGGNLVFHRRLFNPQTEN